MTRTNPDGRHVLRIALHSAMLLAVIAVVSCAGPDRSGTARERDFRPDPSQSAEENLRRLAGREQQASTLRPIDAPLPPGIEPEALAPRPKSDDRAFLSLEQALRELIAAHHPDAADDETAGADKEREREIVEEINADADDASASQALRHYMRGRQAMLDERYYVAITELQQAAQHDPDSPRIRRELARAYMAMNNQGRAMEQYAALRRIDPGDAEAVFSLAIHVANRREFEAAAAIIGRRLLNSQPFDHDPAADLIARYTMAFSLRQLGYDRAFTQSWTLESAEQLITGELFERTMYAARLGAIYRLRAELWRSVGDAHCRLGEFTRALDAYAISAALPAPDPAALDPRVIYANLRLGRVYSAQYELHAALNAGGGTITERDIRLCTYLADAVAKKSPPARSGEWPLRLLAEDVKQRHERSPDDPSLARAAAALLPPREARMVLRDFVDRRPRDLDVAASLLEWLGARDLNAAIVLAVDMVEANPDLALRYVDRLIFAVPDPVKVLEGLDELLPPQPRGETVRAAGDGLRAHEIALAHVKARVLAVLGGPGEAWWLTESYRPATLRLSGIDARTGDAAMIRLLRNAKHIALFRLHLVTVLEEPSLLRPTDAETAPDAVGEMFNSVEAWTIRARMWRSFSRFNEAMDAVEQAVSIAENGPIADADDAERLVSALLEQARTYAAYAQTLDHEGERAQWAEEALFIAERIVNDAHPISTGGDWQLPAADLDGAFEIILTTFGPNGILRDGAQFRVAARRLHERNPNSRLYIRMMAEEAISQGRFDVALERAMNLYDTHPHETGAIDLAMLAWTRMEQPDGLQQGRQWLTERLARRPGDPALLETWVNVMLRLDRADEVIHMLRDIVEQRPRHVTAERLLESCYRATGRTELAFPMGEKRLLNRPQGVRREVELAALYGGMGMEREAIDMLEWLLEHVEDAGYDHLLTGIAILGRIEPADARHDEMTVAFVKHTVLERSARVPLQVYGAAFRSLGRQGRVDDPLFRQLAEHAAELARGSGESFEHVFQWRNLAQALVDDELPHAAAAAIRARIESAAPLAPDALNFLANIALVADATTHGGEGQAEESIAFLQRLAARNRLPVLFGMEAPATLPDALYHTSLIYSIIGDMPGAKRVLEALIDIEPDNAMGLNNLGYLRIEAGHDDERTVRWIELAIELEPEDPHILDTVGWLRYKQGRFDDDEVGRGALSLIRESAELGEEPSGEVQDHLGDVLWRLGRHDEAVEAWRTAERILSDEAKREEMVRTYNLVQQRAWGLLVADPEEMYDRQNDRKLNRVREKLEAVESGDEPPIAPTFAELRRSMNE